MTELRVDRSDFDRATALTPIAEAPGSFAVELGAALQAGRQFGGTFGVALTVAFIGAATSATALAAFDHIWWLIVVGGLTTSALALPMATSRVP